MKTIHNIIFALLVILAIAAIPSNAQEPTYMIPGYLQILEDGTPHFFPDTSVVKRYLLINTQDDSTLEKSVNVTSLFLIQAEYNGGTSNANTIANLYGVYIPLQLGENDSVTTIYGGIFDVDTDSGRGGTVVGVLGSSFGGIGTRFIGVEGLADTSNDRNTNFALAAALPTNDANTGYVYVKDGIFFDTHTKIERDSLEAGMLFWDGGNLMFWDGDEFIKLSNDTSMTVVANSGTFDTITVRQFADISKTLTDTIDAKSDGNIAILRPIDGTSATFDTAIGSNTVDITGTFEDPYLMYRGNSHWFAPIDSDNVVIYIGEDIPAITPNGRQVIRIRESLDGDYVGAIVGFDVVDLDILQTSGDSTTLLTLYHSTIGNETHYNKTYGYYSDVIAITGVIDEHWGVWSDLSSSGARIDSGAGIYAEGQTGFRATAHAGLFNGDVKIINGDLIQDDQDFTLFFHSDAIDDSLGLLSETKLLASQANVRIQNHRFRSGDTLRNTIKVTGLSGVPVQFYTESIEWMVPEGFGQFDPDSGLVVTGFQGSGGATELIVYHLAENSALIDSIDMGSTVTIQNTWYDTSMVGLNALTPIIPGEKLIFQFLVSGNQNDPSYYEKIRLRTDGR